MDDDVGYNDIIVVIVLVVDDDGDAAAAVAVVVAAATAATDDYDNDDRSLCRYIITCIYWSISIRSPQEKFRMILKLLTY